MPRKKKTSTPAAVKGAVRKSKSAPKATPKPKSSYHKSKNNRYYKKTTVNGKCQTRFCSKKEAQDNGVGTGST